MTSDAEKLTEKTSSVIDEQESGKKMGGVKNRRHGMEVTFVRGVRINKHGTMHLKKGQRAAGHYLQG